MDQPSFIKLYFDDLALLHRVSHPASNLFFELCKLIKTDINTFPNAIFLSSRTKQDLAVRAGIAKDIEDRPNIYNTNKYLSELVKGGLLKKVDSNTFIANPDVVCRVEWGLAQKIKQLKVEITYDMVGRNINTIIKQQDEKDKEIQSISTNDG